MVRHSWPVFSIYERMANRVLCIALCVFVRACVEFAHTHTHARTLTRTVINTCTVEM